jgi:glyceraldehyde 3-phosphate dehydrogenase
VKTAFYSTFISLNIMEHRKPKIAINGLGRIGRLVLRLLSDRNDVEVVAVNDLAPNAGLAHLITYDTAQRVFEKNVSADDTHIYIDGKSILSTSVKDIAALPWKDLGVDIVIECTGMARNTAKAMPHIQAGAQKVIISAPADEHVKTIVLGVNEDLLSADDVIISNASCTTNCLAPMVKVLQENFGIESAIMSTVHAYTGDQRLQDGIHKSDLRRARAAAQNITPTTSNATTTLEWVMPEMKGKLIGGAMRVPVIVGSLTELYAVLSSKTDVDAINKAFKAAAEGPLKGILAYTEAPIVSSDIIHDPHSCTFDAGLTDLVNDHFVKIVGWYDNEFGYANRLVELVVKVAYL